MRNNKSYYLGYIDHAILANICKTNSNYILTSIQIRAASTTFYTNFIQFDIFSSTNESYN